MSLPKLKPKFSMADYLGNKQISQIKHERILVEQDKVFAEIYPREDRLWNWIEFEENEEIEFASIDFKMPMRDVYEGTSFSAAALFE